jgi:beta-lactamase regulating signal transducer with metallopeptidase domain/HEAT repeat protein
VNPFIDTTVEPALWRAADWSLRWAVLIGVYVAWLALFRPRRAALRYQAGLGVLLACLMLTAGTRWGPGFGRWSATHFGEAPTSSSAVIPAADPGASGSNPVGWPSQAVRTAKEGRPTESGPAVSSGGDLSGTAPVDSSPDLSSSPPPEQHGTPPIVEAPAPEPLGPRRLLYLVLAGLWLTGTVLLLARLAVGFLLLARLRRTALPASEESLRLLAICRAELGLGRRVSLAVHPRVYSPITLGLFRPTILVPPAWSALPEAARRGSLLHELAHLVRHDDWTALLLEFVRAAFFFHPLLYWLLVRLERDRELLCDETAVAHGIVPAEYARMLVAFARHPGRLSPGVSLPVSSPRTVHIRIHHLLEDTMDRSWKPLSRAGAAALGLAVLGLALGLGSFRVRAIDPTPQPDAPPQAAEEPPPPAKPAEPKEGDKPENPKLPAVPRERLTYGGKTFNDWVYVMQTELKPELRIEAIKALGSFGQHGYGPEAAAAIVDLMKSYKVTTESGQDQNVIQAACQTLGKIGSPALPILLKEMKDKDKNNRRFAFEAVKYIDNFKQIQPAVAVGITDADPWIRRKAVLDLLAIATGDYRQGYLGNYGEANLKGAEKLERAREVVPIVAPALQDRDDEVRKEAIQALGILGKGNQAAISALGQATKDAVPDNRSTACYWLARMGVDAKTAGSLYLGLLKEKDEKVRANGMRYLGPYAKEAVPALIKQLTSGPKEDRALVVHALGVMGRNATAALPELSKLYEEEQDTVLKGAISRAMNSIRRPSFAIGPDGGPISP